MAVVDEIPILIRDYWKPDKCPSELLPYLAAEVSVDEDLADAGSVDEALGPAEVGEVVEPSISADEAAERLMIFRSAISAILALAGR